MTQRSSSQTTVLRLLSSSSATADESLVRSPTVAMSASPTSPNYLVDSWPSRIRTPPLTAVRLLLQLAMIGDEGQSGREHTICTLAGSDTRRSRGANDKAPSEDPSIGVLCKKDRMRFSIRAERPTRAELVKLYGSVGWSAYTEDPAKLKAAVDGSHLVLCSLDDEGRLLGLARTVSDGSTIVYLQNLLVLAEYQREGIGGALLDEVLERSRDIRQLVLLTDVEPAQRAFYESRQLVEAHDLRPHQLRAFVRTMRRSQ